MFSPATAAPQANSVRSSRRRPRPTSSEGSVSQPKTKRQRSALSEQTFLPPDGPPEMQEAKLTKANGSLSRREPARLTQTPRRDLAVRGKKPKIVERATKGDGSVTLTSNDTYVVSRLPAWPDRFQTDPTGRQHGAIYSETGYALALSHTHALVWPYSINNTSPETFTFALPHPAKHASDPLPLGSLVSSSASSPEPGLVVVMPLTGKITYWESVASATTMDLIRQQRNGVELSIPGMLHNETVVQILNAESAGFILGLSSGRVAYMSVRDGQGRPDVSVQFLRGTSGPSGGGIFGSLRNALSSSAWRGELAAARAGPVVKPGERDVVTVTSKGKIQAWTLLRGGLNSLHAEAESRDVLVSELKATNTDLKDLLIESFEVLDFTFTPKSLLDRDGESDPADGGTQLLLLTSLGGRGSTHYALVQVSLKVASIEIGMIRHIQSYTSPINRSATSRPRVYLPKPGVVAFLIFDRAVVVASMARQPDSPESQLLADNHIQTRSFEDVVDFRVDKGVEITGSGMEEPHAASHSQEDSKSRRYKAKHPAVMLLVRGGGVIRIAATDPYKLVGNKAPQVTAKSKLEQAVFFGTLENNLLRFTGRAEMNFTVEEVGQAALELSHEILSSTTTYIPAMIASIEDNLQKRSSALRALVTHLAATNVALNRATRWRLLWDAEKIAGAKCVWERYDASIRQKPAGQKRGLLNDIVEYIHENYKTEPVKEAGELDRVRHWFINDIYRLQIAIPWAYQVVKYMYQEGDLDHAAIVSLISEADDFVKGALEGAFDFRTNNINQYGLQEEELNNGILQSVSAYKDLPEFWTSTMLVSENVKKLTDLARSLAVEYWQKQSGEGLPNPNEVNKIRLENVQLVDICTTCTTERYRWLLAQDDRQLKSVGEYLQGSSYQVEHTQICFLADLRLIDEAMGLAEKHRVYTALASLIVEGMEGIVGALQEAAKKKEPTGPLERRSSYLAKLLGRYFDTFGADFATAFYKYYVERGELFAMLDDDEHTQYLSSFLRSKQSFAKVSWINDVTRDKDFDHAAKTLLDMGLRREQHLWSKKVELSIGKLARLAGKQYSEANGLLVPEDGYTELMEVKRQIALAHIQDRVFAHVQPSINNAVDESAELQLAMEVFGSSDLNGKPALSNLLAEPMSALIGHQALTALQMVDLLTLMGPTKNLEEEGLIDGQEFYLALEALKSGPLDKTEQVLTEKVIWRRCMIRDDWSEINDTASKDDYHVSRQLQRTALYSTLRACVKNRIFEKPSSLHPVGPREAQGACTEELDDRFRGLDDSIRNSLMKDMQTEDAALTEYINKCRLEKWFEAALELAKKDVKDELNNETEDGYSLTVMAAELLQIKEEKIEKEGQAKAKGLLRSKPRYRHKLNGTANGLKSSLDLTDDGRMR